MWQSIFRWVLILLAQQVAICLLCYVCPCMSLSQQRAQIRWDDSDIRMVLRCTAPSAAFDGGGKHFSIQQIGRSKIHSVPHNHLHFAFVSCTPVSKLDRPLSLSQLLTQVSLEPSEESTSVVIPLSKAEVPMSPPSSDPKPSPSSQPQPPPSSALLSFQGILATSPPLVSLSTGSAMSQPHTSFLLHPGLWASWLLMTSKSRMSLARLPMQLQ